MKANQDKDEPTLVEALVTTNKKAPPTDHQQNTNTFRERYAPNWGAISLECIRSTKGICCYLNCTNQAIASHHGLYQDDEGSVAGREIIGVHIFPLCKDHHSVSHEEGAHHYRNWISKCRNPRLTNRNTVSYYLKLREGWLCKSGRN
jgi:hypothetical protein